MKDNNEQTGFESRVLTDFGDVLAVVNHLDDNLSDSDKPLKVILTIEPRRFKETDYCSIKESRVEKILVKSKKEILDINKILNKELFIANVHVAIE